MAKPPSPNGGNGRDSRGRFSEGNPGGPGNPNGHKSAEIRRMIREAVSDDDLREIVAALVRRARKGDLTAIGMVLDRLAGKPVNSADAYKLERTEEIDETFDVPGLLGR